jgi:hypothetical protein
MSFTSVTEPQPSLAWQFESSNVDSVTSLAPSAQVSPGPAQLVGSAALVTNAPTSNTAVSFPGTSGSYMLLNSTPATFDLATSNLFVECWVYFNSLATQYQCIVADGPTGSGASQECWIIRINPSNTVDFIINVPAIKTATSSTTITTGQWYHIAASYNSGSSIGYIFVNGGTPNSVASVTPKTSTGASFTIGAYPSPSSGIYMNGYIRDLRVVQGGVVPVATFTPGSAPFSYTLPSYVTGSGSVVFTLLGQFITYNPSGKYGKSVVIQNDVSKASGNNGMVWNAAFNVDSGITISFWVKVQQIGANTQTLLQYSGSSGGGSTIIFNMNGTVGTVAMWFRDATYHTVTSSALSVNTWNHLCLSVGAGNVTAYLNGVSQGATTYTPSGATVSSFTLGAYGGSLFTPSTGEYDDLRIYNTALTSTQVQSVYSSQGAPAPGRVMPQPQLAWDFNGTTTPYIGSATTSVTGSVSYSGGKYNQAVNIANNPVGSPNAGANYITWTNYGTFNPSVGVTVCFWINVNALPASGQQSIPLWMRGSAVNSAVFITLTPTYWGAAYTDGTNYYVPTSSAPLSTGVWYHLTVVVGAGTVAGYQNGVQISNPVAFSNPLDVSGFLYLGGNGNYGPASAIYDDLRIYNTALTSIQVNDIYNQQGVPGRGALQALIYSNIASPTLYSFSSQIFSNAQATSNIGPTQSQLNTVYPSLAPTYLTSNTGIQTWTVPVTGTYSIVAAGAVGGTGSSGGGTAGRGVIVGCQAIFQKNQVISIIVGQAGVSAALQTTSNIGGGGGGGSFIVDYSTGYLYIAAGGGGGASAQGISPSGFDASFGQDGVNGTSSGTSGTNVSPGGTGGNGGASFPGGGSNGNAGGGGGGFYTNGGQVFSGQPGQGGFAVLNGAQGGLSSNVLNFTNSFGGFGGGGGSGGHFQVIINNGAGGGGGGGYSGGGAGSRAGLGAGGGGSYVPLGQTMTQIGYCTSNGYVSINYLAPVAVKLTGAPLFNQLSPAATSSAVGAFSLRSVNGVSTRAVQVRNGTTSATQDFYADERGNLLTAPVTGTTLQNWLGSATGYVTTWYDQSGAGNHMSCSSSGIQPKIDIVNNFIDLKPSAYFDVSAGTTGPVPFQSGKNYTVVFRHGQFVGSGLFCATQNAAGPYGNLVNNFKKGTGSTYTQYWYGNDVNNKGVLATGNRVSYKWDGTNRSLYVNGTLADATPSSGWAQTSSSIQMIGKTNFDAVMNGELYGAFMFTTALSDTDRTLLENFL